MQEIVKFNPVRSENGVGLMLRENRDGVKFSRRCEEKLQTKQKRRGHDTKRNEKVSGSNEIEENMSFRKSYRRTTHNSSIRRFARAK